MRKFPIISVLCDVSVFVSRPLLGQDRQAEFVTALFLITP
jgi:hypothetical protein